MITNRSSFYIKIGTINCIESEITQKSRNLEPGYCWIGQGTVNKYLRHRKTYSRAAAIFNVSSPIKVPENETADDSIDVDNR